MVLQCVNSFCLRCDSEVGTSDEEVMQILHLPCATQPIYRLSLCRGCRYAYLPLLLLARTPDLNQLSLSLPPLCSLKLHIPLELAHFSYSCTCSQSLPDSGSFGIPLISFCHSFLNVANRHS